MQPKKQKSKKRVSFATAMVTTYDNEEPTIRIEYNMKQDVTEAALTGSFIQDIDSPNASIHDTNSKASPGTPIPKGTLSRISHNNTNSNTSTNSNTEFLENMFSNNNKEIPNLNNLDDLYNNTNEIISPIMPSNFNNNNNTNGMDIDENNNDNDDDNMSLTGTYEYDVNVNNNNNNNNESLQNLFEDDDDMDDMTTSIPNINNNNNNNNNNNESLQHLFSDDGITTSIPNFENNNNQSFKSNNNNNNDNDIEMELTEPINTNNNHQSNGSKQTFALNNNNNNNNEIISGNSQSFNTQTKHLQINNSNSKQSTNEFNINLNQNTNTNTNNTLNDKNINKIINDTIQNNNNTNNNGSFTNNNTRDNNTLNDNNINKIINENVSKQYNINNSNNTNKSINESSLLFTSPTIMNIEPTSPSLGIDDEHTLKIHIPSKLMRTPLNEKQKKLFRKRRSSMHNNSNNNNNNTDTGSVTRVFHVKVNNTNTNNNNNISPESSLNNTHNTSLNTLMDDVGDILQNEYIQTMDKHDINVNKIRNVVVNTPDLRDKQMDHKYSMRLNNNNNNNNENDMNNINKQQNKQKTMDWRDIALKNEWFENRNNNITKYSLGLGLGNNNKTFTESDDKKEIILHEICDKIEYFEWNKLSENVSNVINNTNNNIKIIEENMDKKIIENNKILINNIQKFGENDKIKMVSEYFSVKKTIEFDKKKLECLDNMNTKMNSNYNNLKHDLNQLKIVYSNLKKQEFEKENEINKLKTFDTNDTICNLQKQILENDKLIENSKMRENKYDLWINNEKNKRNKLENDIKLKENELNELTDNVNNTNNNNNNNYQELKMEIINTIEFINGVTGIRLHKMTENKIEIILMENVSFSMEYNNKTKNIYNIQFRQHPNPKYSDKFSKYLINMVSEIGNKIDIYNTLKTLTDLKIIIYEIIQQITGIAELRAAINLCKNIINIQNEYKLIIAPLRENNNMKLDEINLRINMSRDIEYNNNKLNGKIMKTQLLIMSVWNIKLGYPFNRLVPKIATVLNRQLWEKNLNKFKSVTERTEQMLIEKKFNKMLERKLSGIKLGANLLIRCVNLIHDEMKIVLENESNCRHSNNIYS